MKRIPFLDDNALPYSRALSYVMENYEDSLSRDASEFMVSQTPWDDDAPLFLTTLMAVGVFTFVVTSKGASMLHILHEFQRLDWEIVGLDTVICNRIGNINTTEIVEGIRVRYKHAESFVNCPEYWNAVGARIESYQEV